MQVLPRRIGVVLLGALAAMALGLTMTARADAATTKVEIVTKATINGQSNRVLAPRSGGKYAISSPSNPSSDLKTFIKTDVGQNSATYRWSQNPDKCLTAPQSSRSITLEPCNFGPDQLWTQGFSGGVFREFRNVQTGRSATAEEPKFHNGTFYAEVVQEIFSGRENQLWQVRAV